jgi:hypothetical protein
MTGIVAALEADDDIRLLRQPVDDLALSLVAPLGTDDDNVGHFAGIPCKGEARLSTPNSKFVSLCSGPPYRTSHSKDTRTHDFTVVRVQRSLEGLAEKMTQFGRSHARHFIG